jgi:N6-adenosine-specific RNA methylase IME4
MCPAPTVKPLNSLTTKFGCIVADPPWPEIGGGKIKRGADRHYPTMKIEEIAALPVKEIVLPDSHLYLWVTNNYLRRAFEVVDAWGFQYITTLTWRKEGRVGLGQYFRGTTEHVFFCRRGCPPYRTRPDGKRAQGVTDFEVDGAWWSEERPGNVHSRKPVKIHEWAELVSHGPYLEMFARTARTGWTAWGNEAPQVYDRCSECGVTGPCEHERRVVTLEDVLS